MSSSEKNDNENGNAFTYSKARDNITREKLVAGYEQRKFEVLKAYINT